MITIEDGTLLISLIGRFDDYAPTDKEGFLAFARELHSDIATRIIEGAEQLTRIGHHRFVISVQRHYELMASFPEGFLVIGDALCTFNPIYAQEMSVAARQAQVLPEILSERAAQSCGLDRITFSFFPKAADLNSTLGIGRLLLISPSLRPAASGHWDAKSAPATSPYWISFSWKTFRFGGW